MPERNEEHTARTHRVELLKCFFSSAPDEYCRMDIEEIRVTDARVVGERGSEEIAIEVEVVENV